MKKILFLFFVFATSCHDNQEKADQKLYGIPLDSVTTYYTHKDAFGNLKVDSNFIRLSWAVTKAMERKLANQAANYPDLYGDTDRCHWDLPNNFRFLYNSYTGEYLIEKRKLYFGNDITTGFALDGSITGKYSYRKNTTPTLTTLIQGATRNKDTCILKALFRDYYINVYLPEFIQAQVDHLNDSIRHLKDSLRYIFKPIKKYHDQN